VRLQRAGVAFQRVAHSQHHPQFPRPDDREIRGDQLLDEQNGEEAGARRTRNRCAAGRGTMIPDRSFLGEPYAPEKLHAVVMEAWENSSPPDWSGRCMCVECIERRGENTDMQWEAGGLVCGTKPIAMRT
jgi:hypothetical protein